MIIKKISLPLAIGLAGAVLLCVSQDVCARQQHFPDKGEFSEDWTAFSWDNEHPLSYEDVLREKILASASFGSAVTGKNLLWQEGIASRVSHFDIDWNFPLVSGITTGPTAGLRWDGSDNLLPGSGRYARAGSDPLWHASTTAFGWQVTGHMGALQPWARLGYYQQYGENQWKAQPGMGSASGTQQEKSWTELRVGADMPVTANLAAFAMFSQAEGLNSGESLLYLMGINAQF